MWMYLTYYENNIGPDMEPTKEKKKGRSRNIQANIKMMGLTWCQLKGKSQDRSPVLTAYTTGVKRLTS